MTKYFIASIGSASFILLCVMAPGLQLCIMEKKDVYILAIESSCDDTSAAVMRGDVVLSNVTASQAVHEQYGGVVPELASRAHEQNIVPVVDAALKRAGVAKEQLSAIAFTRGPGTAYSSTLWQRITSKEVSSSSARLSTSPQICRYG